MAFIYKLELEDGTSADPPTFAARRERPGTPATRSLSQMWRGRSRPLPLPTDYGNVGSAYDPPKMSVFPNVGGQTLFGAGAVGSVVDVPVRKLYNAWR